MTQTAERIDNVTQFPHPLFSINTNYDALSGLDWRKDDPSVPLEANVNGGLLLMASRFTASGGTVDAITGVLLLPLPNGGVMMTALDGHCGAAFFDAEGTLSKPVVIRVLPDMQKALKPTKKLTTRMIITPDLQAKVVASGQPLFVAPGDIRITDIFPDIRNFFLKSYTFDLSTPQALPSSSLAKYSLHPEGALVVFPTENNGPIFIRNTRVPEFLGLMMPFVGESVRDAQHHPYPKWFPGYIPEQEGKLWRDMLTAKKRVAEKV